MFKIIILCIIVFLAGLALGSALVNSKLKSYKRRLEKTSVDSSGNASKVKILEAKIKTLEKAFEESIKSETDG